MNLDPTDTFSDESLWRALELVNLKTYVSNLFLGLQYEMTEGGANFRFVWDNLIKLGAGISLCRL